jgi:hypothetical protein
LGGMLVHHRQRFSASVLEISRSRRAGVATVSWHLLGFPSIFTSRIVANARR